jgi:hypothetical protein
MTRLLYQGMLVGILITIFAESVHWFITPEAHTASSGRRIGVVIQMVVVLALAFIVWRRAKRDAMVLEMKLLTSESA